MRATIVSVLFLATVLAPALSAETIVRHRDPAAGEHVAARSDAQPGRLAGKLDAPADILLVPFYEVDTTDPGGTTTLFAVRNITTSDLDIEIRYLTGDATVVRSDLLTLDPRATLTRNVRDVAGLPADPDGFARGYIAVLVDGMPPGTDNMVGDYFQIDVGDAFAAGERMPSLLDLCDEHEIRFLDFGSGTELRFLVNNPRGTDTMVDPPTFTARVFGEDGAALGMVDVYTDVFPIELAASDFTALSFGTLVFDFSNGGGGIVYGEYSADGLFSVGLNSACTAP